MNELEPTLRLNKFDKFLNTPWYYVLLGAIVLLAWSFEKTIWGLAALLVIFSAVMLFSRNSLHSIPIIFSFYYSFSPEYKSLGGKEWMLFLMIIPVTMVITHIVIYKPKLKIRGYGVAMLISTIPWLLQGLERRIKYTVTDYFSPKILWIGYGVLAAIGLMILLFYLLYDSQDDYNRSFLDGVCRTLIYTAVIILLQSTIKLSMTFYDHSLQEISAQIGGGVKLLELGWASSNNIAAYLSLILPITAHYAIKHPQKATLYFILTLLEYVVIVITRSRGPLLFVTIAMPILLIYLFVKTTKLNRLRFGMIICAITFVVGIASIWINDLVIATANKLGEMGLDDNGRFEIYKDALNVFKEFPIFGGGIDVYYFTDTAPWQDIYNRPGVPRWFHSTILQIIASFGIVGALAYAYQFAYRYSLCFRRAKDYRVFLILMGFILFDLYGLIDVNFFSPMLYFMIMLLTMALDKDDDYLAVGFLSHFPKKIKTKLEKNGERWE